MMKVLLSDDLRISFVLKILQPKDAFNNQKVTGKLIYIDAGILSTNLRVYADRGAVITS